VFDFTVVDGPTGPGMTGVEPGIGR
jgi:hypothetical protein